MKNILLAVLCLSSFASLSQKNAKEIKYEKIYYKDTKFETTDLLVSFVDAVSTDGEIKFKIRITNKSGDFIMYKPEESKFIIEGKETNPSEKWVVVEPYGSASRVINLKGPNYNKVKNYSFALEGLYRIPNNSKGIAVPDFRLPASQNQFTAGNFSCTMAKLNKETDKTSVKFKCTYTGDQIGIIYPSRIAVRMPDGKDYATIHGNAKAILLYKGEDDAFVAEWNRMEGGAAMDMQKVEMMIKWNETFTENSTQKINGTTVELAFDEPLSNDKGR